MNSSFTFPPSGYPPNTAVSHAYSSAQAVAPSMNGHLNVPPPTLARASRSSASRPGSMNPPPPHFHFGHHASASAPYIYVSAPEGPQIFHPQPRAPTSAPVPAFVHQAPPSIPASAFGHSATTCVPEKLQRKILIQEIRVATTTRRMMIEAVTGVDLLARPVTPPPQPTTPNRALFERGFDGCMVPLGRNSWSEDDRREVSFRDMFPEAYAYLDRQAVAAQIGRTSTF